MALQEASVVAKDLGEGEIPGPFNFVNETLATGSLKDYMFVWTSPTDLTLQHKQNAFVYAATHSRLARTV